MKVSTAIDIVTLCFLRAEQQRDTFDVKASVCPFKTGTKRDSIGLWSSRAMPLGPGLTCVDTFKAGYFASLIPSALGFVMLSICFYLDLVSRSRGNRMNYLLRSLKGIQAVGAGALATAG